MAQHRQLGFDRTGGLLGDHDYAAAATTAGNHQHYANGGGSGGVDNIAIGIRNPLNKQPRYYHRRSKNGGRSISIGGVVVGFLCFVLAASALAFVFLSSRGHSDIDTSEAQDYDFLTNDFLMNVTRITTSQLSFGHDVVTHGFDSRDLDGDDRRRDEDYKEDMVHKSETSNKLEEEHYPSNGKSPVKNMSEHTEKTSHGWYNEAGRNELKRYEEKYEASLKNVGQSDEHNHGQQHGEIDKDDEYDDGIDSHDNHTDDHGDVRHENELNSDLPNSHSIDNDDNNTKARDANEILAEGSFLSNGGKDTHSGLANELLKTTSGKRSKKHSRHRKVSSSHCEMKLLNSTAQLVEPLESRKFIRFSLSYTKKEVRPDEIENWEPRFAAHQGLREKEDSFLARDQKINCGFVKGPAEYSGTGFVLAEDDIRYITKCHIAVISCIFGNSDRLRHPFVKSISHLTRKNVCFVMFMDEPTLQTLSSEGEIPDRMGFIGLWRVVVVKNLPYPDMRKVGKIPKFLAHRLFPSARYSIWLDSKLRLQIDPLLLLEHFLWRKGHEYAISNHYDRHCVWEEVERNKKLNKFNHTMIDQQFAYYQADGLKRFNASDPNKLLPSNVPEGSLIIRAHTPMSNLFSCLWFNEVDHFTPRDQLSFAYTYHKLRKKNPTKPFYLHMFKDCQRRQIARFFHHRTEEKHVVSQDIAE